ncbi:type III pantothenate kinase [Pedobacter rhizosphaerae]|uniref:Type III pantothenate kinase n=1 Tax=Pedobacter rhizosphaerae TaxID=390241 RepID=A0A1H9VXB6_9SPHI|nr:type III pantothenate kinase [Pedobacter rhizosphaerae]SES26134.1 type III pantothenate kinase [Pedobacter rhizosphaerae]
MNRLSIDIGNSSVKIAVFNNRELVHHQRLNKLGVQELQSLVNEFSISKSIISSVNQDINLLEDFLKSHTDYTRFSALLTNGVENKYKTPGTLGLDRWAAILGAKGSFPAGACLVVDAGTCITYDLLLSDSTYWGGSISPGIEMRFKAVHEFTKRLPLVDWNAEADIEEGTDTPSAIRNGVLQGIVNEIEGFIAINNKKESALRVIITGGDANFLYKQLQNSIFAPQIVKDAFIVLKGLNEAIAD